MSKKNPRRRESCFNEKWKECEEIMKISILEPLKKTLLTN